MRFYMGSPVARTLITECAIEISKWWGLSLLWAKDNGHVVNVPFGWSPGVRLDVARSSVFDTAKRFGADWLITIDSDVRPEVPLSRIVEIGERAKKAGFDLVLSSTPSIAGAEMIEWMPGVERRRSGPFQVLSGPMGLTLVSNRVLREMKPVGQHVFSVEGFTLPAIFDMPHDSGEDTSFFHRAYAQGFLTAVDYDLRTSHLKGMWTESPR